MGTLILIGIASAGIVWIFVCFALWIKHIKKVLKTKTKWTVKAEQIFSSPWLRDGALSVFLIYIGGVIFVGVMGMAIGLIASVMLSLTLWILKGLKVL